MSCKPRTLSPEQDDFLKANTDLTVAELAQALDVPLHIIYSSGGRLKLTFKSARIPKPATEYDRAYALRSRPAEKKAGFVRPPAEYSNQSPWGVASANRIL